MNKAKLMNCCPKCGSKQLIAIDTYHCVELLIQDDGSIEYIDSIPGPVLEYHCCGTCDYPYNEKEWMKDS